MSGFDRRLHSFGLYISLVPCLVSTISLAAPQSERLSERASVPANYQSLPFYPAPYGGWASDWHDSYAKAHDLVSRMTLAEVRPSPSPAVMDVIILY